MCMCAGGSGGPWGGEPGRGLAGDRSHIRCGDTRTRTPTRGRGVGEGKVTSLHAGAGGRPRPHRPSGGGGTRVGRRPVPRAAGASLWRAALPIVFLPQNFPRQVRVTGLEMRNFLSGFTPGWLNHRGSPGLPVQVGCHQGCYKGIFTYSVKLVYGKSIIFLLKNGQISC